MTRTRLGRILGMLVAVALVVPPVPAAAVQPNEFCGDVQLVWARGSGVAVDTLDFPRFNKDLDDRIGPEITYSAYQLGKNGGFGGFVYPAQGDLGQLAEEWAGIHGAYADSAAIGVAELEAYLTHRAIECPTEVFVLGGWSQGAEVIGRGLFGLSRDVRDRIAYVALFGDPTLDTGNFSLVSVPFSPACVFGQRQWIRGSAPCWISGGIFGSRIPYLPPDIEPRVGSWCRMFDAACSGGTLIDLAGTILGVHRQYFDENSDSAMAAREAALSLQTFLPDQANDLDVTWLQFASGPTGADLVFVFDTTGSMYEEIANAKAQATVLAHVWLTIFPNGRIALVQYRDQGDEFVSRIELGLTNDVAQFQTALNGLSADGGGDTPEAMLSALMTALNGLAWRDGAIKTAIVITDAIGKDPEPVTGFTRTQVDQRALQIDPVAIYGVNVRGDPEVSDFFAPLTAGTGGQVFELQPGQSLSDALFDVLDTVHFSPVATLNGPYLVPTGTAIRFHTNGSFDADAELVAYEWDFNGDGTVDQTTSSPEVLYTYPGEFHGLAAVRVISSDGGSALATAQVTVDNVGLGNLMPLAPVAASASITGADEVTVTWTPAPNDRAEGYKVILPDGTVVGLTVPSGPHSFVVSGLDLSQPVTLLVVASNSYGNSAAVPAGLSSGTTISSLGDAHGWLGLRTADDQGTQFDLRVELLKNDSPVASGMKRCITGVTRNSQSAKEAVVPWDAFSAVPVAAGDVLALRFSARIGTKPDNTKCSGPGGSHNSAVGLRLYYDAASRNSRFAATIGANPSVNLYLHSNGGACDRPVATNESQGVTNRQLSSIVPGTAPAKCKDSGVLNFAGGNKWVTLSTWSLAPLP